MGITSIYAHAVGLPVYFGPAQTFTLLNSANNRCAYSFFGNGGTLSTVRQHFANVTGTLGGSDILADLYDSTGTNGAPGGSIETGKTPSATITAVGWYTFTGFSSALTDGQMYWIVFRNANGTPGSNWVTPTGMQNNLPVVAGGSGNRQFYGMASSTNGGSSWSVSGLTSGATRAGYSGGSFDGSPLSNGAAGAVGDGVYAARECGVVFTSPANAALRVAGLGMYVSAKTGTPTGVPRLGLWLGTIPANQGYAALPLTTTITTSQWVRAGLASPVTIPPSTVVRVTLAEASNADASGNRYNAYHLTCDTDADSLAILPWNGTLRKTYFDGSSWADANTAVVAHALYLDPAGEFSAAVRGKCARNHLIGSGLGVF